MRTPNFENAAITVLVLCAATVTAMMVRREFSTRASKTSGVPTEIANWKSYAEGEMQIGPPNARVTIVEFSDFQCPACGQLYPIIGRVLAKYPNDIRLVYRNFPIERLHPSARGAALASQCAAAQGKFKEYHELLFQHQDSLGMIPWERLAGRASVPNTRDFVACLASPRAASLLRRDSLAGEALHIRGTPTVLVNKWMLNETPSDAGLEDLVSQELALSK